MPLDIPILPQILKLGGYQTHAVGKCDAGMSSWLATPTYRGFDSFFGYYGCHEDHFTHSVYPNNIPFPGKCHGLDLRNNTNATFDYNGTYSTHIYTAEIMRIIDNYQPDDAPLFLYTAYQAVHAPLQVPDQYVTYTDCMNVPESNRRILCGMAKTVDEGILNITTLLKAKGMYDDTVIVFMSDNGGDNHKGGNNWPYRGNKNTVWEGALRSASFVAGFGVPASLQGTRSAALMHVTDWLPTLAHIADVPVDHLSIDGVDQYDTIYLNASSARQDVLLQLDPPAFYDGNHFIGQIAYRSGAWKLILGRPNCTNIPLYVPFSDPCASGWVHVNGTEIAPPPNSSRVWLFNIDQDPLEHNNLAEEYPDIVATLRSSIEVFNSTHVVQAKNHFSFKACPNRFTPPAWTPWEW